MMSMKIAIAGLVSAAVLLGVTAAHAQGVDPASVAPFVTALVAAALAGLTYVFQWFVNRVKGNLSMSAWMVIMPIFVTGLGLFATYVQAFPLPADWPGWMKVAAAALIALFGAWAHDQQLWMQEEKQGGGAS